MSQGLITYGKLIAEVALASAGWVIATCAFWNWHERRWESLGKYPRATKYVVRSVIVLGLGLTFWVTLSQGIDSRKQDERVAKLLNEIDTLNTTNVVLQSTAKLLDSTAQQLRADNKALRDSLNSAMVDLRYVKNATKEDQPVLVSVDHDIRAVKSGFMLIDHFEIKSLKDVSVRRVGIAYWFGSPVDSAKARSGPCPERMGRDTCELSPDKRFFVYRTDELQASCPVTITAFSRRPILIDSVNWQPRAR
jgi:hypothetical protein